ncbi:MAG: hypothetical protein QM813_00270 [Verrucomicrobiota bacterium]
MVASLFFTSALTVRAALLAYEPFTNLVGTAIIGSAGGVGFSGGLADLGAFEDGQ